ncbi:hypothetical protein M0C34_11260 [Agarivorans sp. TSD2052]|uniref:hypothetical protein n=1 Tax=Agarivorans sp. TSD2052 TaxID=2937286 RepID=UPI00200BD15D|nr:hypothetical protein [Agarivorans sp. TSD2052]UPW16825.1 hypothetical protein M0C34_11260 [Agarivorans sp. TSD2052]
MDPVKISEYSKLMLREFINMLISLGKAVVVEGVGSIEELGMLKSMDSKYFVRLYYSYSYSKIVPKHITDKFDEVFKK